MMGRQRQYQYLGEQFGPASISDVRLSMPTRMSIGIDLVKRMLLNQREKHAYASFSGFAKVREHYVFVLSNLAKNGRANERWNERTNERSNERTNARSSARTNGRTSE